MPRGQGRRRGRSTNLPGSTAGRVARTLTNSTTGLRSGPIPSRRTGAPAPCHSIDGGATQLRPLAPAVERRRGLILHGAVKSVRTGGSGSADGGC